MAELHLIGQILSACDFEEPTLFCKWSIQYGNTNTFETLIHSLDFDHNLYTLNLGDHQALIGNM